ncbi:MAG TPA: hypothetical protein VEH52_11605 [Gaiellaceae bacterium]|jgi:hypothetical protein|nr:hypothetical protein [Gaiellaceae bacterium]
MSEKNRSKEISPELAQYLARSVLDTLGPDVYEALQAFTPEELDKLTQLGTALRGHDGCEPDRCTATLYMIH